MAEHTYQEYLQLRKGGAPPPDSHEAAVRVYADTGGALRSLQSDGTDAAVGGGGGSSPVTLMTQRTFTDAQIKSLPTDSPVELVAAPGADKLIVPLWAILRCDTTNDGYSNIAGNGSLYIGTSLAESLLIVLAEGAGSSAKVSSLLSSFTDYFAFLTPSAGRGIAADSVATNQFGYALESDLYVDQPLSLWVDNQASGDYQDGNALNTLKAQVAYILVDFA